MTTRCVAITQDNVYSDGQSVHPVDHTRTLGGIGRFLAQMSDVFRDNTEKGNGSGTVLLARGTHVSLGLPADLPDSPDEYHPALAAARASGWHISGVAPWMTFWGVGRPTVHVGVLDWLSVGSFPLLEPTSMVRTTERCRQFHNLIGAPYHGIHAGLPGITALRNSYRKTFRYREPMWRPRNWDHIDPAHRATETAADWSRPGRHSQPWELGWDVNTQYLSAAGVATFAVGELEQRPVLTQDWSAPILPGYYRVYVSEWPWADYMPHPAGDHQPGESVWVTAPTLELIVQIATEDPTFAYPQVFDRWISPTGARLMRHWVERIQDAVYKAHDTGDPSLLTTIKDTYKAGRGMLERPTSRVYRPDWSHTIIGQARSNLWRKVWKQGAEEWPVAVAADTVWYPAADDNHLSWWPRHFPDNRGAGGFHVYGAHNTSDPALCWTETRVGCPRCPAEVRREIQRQRQAAQ